ncbi:MAG TPA: DUF928 domain-containing protein [Crinalium sp.]
MTQHPHFQPQRFWIALKSTGTLQRATVSVSVVLLLSLAIAPTVLAGYKPPKSSRPSGSTIGTVVRGEGSCAAGTKGALTALAPLGHIGQTTATHPTFAWYVADNQSYPIEFTLYRYASNGKLVSLYQTQLKSQKGIMQYSLPQDETGLNIGQTYLWQVALLCSSSSPDKDQVLRTDVEVVATPATLQTSLAKTTDHSQRANLYAEAGFWYDAFAEALAADSKTKSVSIPLLEDLVKVEAAETSQKGKQQHDRLQQVLEIERQ